MKNIESLLLFLLGIFPTYSQVLINEFEPNPKGLDPSTQNIELKGTPRTSFEGVIISVEGDKERSDSGTVERLSKVSGNFDENGLLLVTVPDLENPSFSLILLSSYSGKVGDYVDPLVIQPNVLDAVGIADSMDDLSELLADNLGGVNLIPPNSTEPTLFFRDPVDSSAYVVINNTIYDKLGDKISASEFNGDPTLPSFGTENLSSTHTVLSNTHFRIEKKAIKIYPNPTKNKEVNIKVDLEGTIAVEVYTIAGEKIVTFSTDDKRMDLQNLASGIYVIKLGIGNQRVFSRLIMR